ncbi:MAG: DinB family protein [Dehalococcoidia bacterium]
MDIRDSFLNALNDAHRMGDIALEDLTPEVAHFDAGGTTNTIAQLLSHLTMGEDAAFNRMITGGTRIIETDSWAEKCGIPLERGAVWGKEWKLNIDAFREYRELVKKSASGYIETMDLADLDKEVEAFNGLRPVHNIMQIIVINHMLGHEGEVSTLKGIQGLKGLPF